MAGKPNPMITINSAYRTRRRNAGIEGAALNSMHVTGKAVDITVRGVENWQVAEMAKHFRGGGVGHYNTYPCGHRPLALMERLNNCYHLF